MIRKSQSASANSQEGFVIVAVLWIITALAALATIFSVYLSNSAQTLAAGDTAVQAEALISASLELTTYQLSLAEKNARPAQGSFRYRLANANVFVSYVSEASRIDLNHAPKELLANLFSGLGADQDHANEYADRIIGWRTPPKANSANDEVSLYSAAGLNYSPRQAPFAHINELALVLGLPPVLVDRALPFVTVFSGVPAIDVLVAPAEVIAALPGMTPLALKEFLDERATLPRDKIAIATALGPAQANATVDKSDVFRILTNIKFDNGRQTSSEVVIRLGDGEDPYHVLSWQDDVEPKTSNPRQRADY